MRPPSTSRRLTSGRRTGIEPCSRRSGTASARPARRRGAAAAGCRVGRRLATAAPAGAGRAPASSPDTPCGRFGPTAQQRRSLLEPGLGLADFRALATEDRRGPGELGVVVAQQQPDRRALLGKIPAGVAGLLGGPRRVRVGRDAGNDAPSAAELDERQHRQRLEPDRLHRAGSRRRRSPRPGLAGTAPRWARSVVAPG